MPNASPCSLISAGAAARPATSATLSNVSETASRRVPRTAPPPGNWQSRSKPRAIPRPPSPRFGNLRSPADLETTRALGAILFSRGDLLAAREVFYGLAHRAPDDVDGLVRLGLVHARLGDAREAEIRWRRALALDPACSSIMIGKMLEENVYTLCPILTLGTGADPKFEIRVPSHFSGGDFGCGVPKGPFVRPETGLGGRGHFRGETRSRSCPSGA